MNPPDITITARPLTRAEAVVLHRELKTTPNILGYSPRELQAFSRVLVAETANGEMVGTCLSKDLLHNWTDIAVLYVLPAHRGMGISRPLWEAALADAAIRKRHVYVLSRTPQVIHLMKAAHFQIARSAWNAPFAVHLHTQIHMMSWFRNIEAFRKIPQRRTDSFSFVAGTKRYEPPAL